MSNTDWEHKIRYTSDAVGKHEVQIDLLKRSDEARAQNLHDLDQRLKICEARSERVPALETSVNQVVPLKEDVQGLRAGFSEMQSLVDKLGQLHLR